MEILYRQARKADSFRLAELVDMASDGVSTYLFHDIIPGLTPIQLAAQGLEADHFPHSDKSAIVAEHKGIIVGIALSYPSHLHKVTQEMMQFFPRERLEHLQSFYSAREENSLFLDALAVDEEFRGKGIGSALISSTKEKAKERDYDQVSLIVFADNTDALHCYKRNGFEIVKRVDLKPNEFIPHENGCLLMNCKLAKQGKV